MAHSRLTGQIMVRLQEIYMDFFKKEGNIFIDILLCVCTK